ncbi:MAG: hypothetical protein EOP04_20155 [Proteobacteria bacterium]|nr:MAG: hypothetical protein EOP04_20155 [Pseudomonadota bacterium]
MNDWLKIEKETARLRGLWAAPSNSFGQRFIEQTGEVLTKECSAIDLLKRPNISFDQIAALTDSKVSQLVGEQIEIGVKYAGYIDRQHDDIAQLKKLEQSLIPAEFDYDIISGLSGQV